MGGKHDKHDKIRGKERKGKKVEDVKSTPTRNSRDKRQCGCPVPEPILCSIGTLPDSEDDGVAMKCSYVDCPFAGQRVHLACFRSFENHLVKIMSTLGSARGWTDSQRRANLWEKKGRSLIARYCDCRCGHGKTGRDEEVFYEQVQKQRHDEEAATAGQKKKVGKSKVLPKLNFGIVKSSVMAHLEEPRLPKRSTGRRRDLSTSSLSSISHTYALDLDSSFGHRESLMYGSDCKALSMISGNIADHDDSISICSRNDVFDANPDLVPAPLPPRQTRSYASAIKNKDVMFEDSTSIQNDVCADSGIELKSGSCSTGSECDDSKDLQSTSPMFTMPETPVRRPLLQQPDHNNSLNDSLFASFANNIAVTSTPKVEKQVERYNFVSTDLVSPIGSSKLYNDCTEEVMNTMWDIFSGSSFLLGETIIGLSALPGFYKK